jgi:hypothetical protein
MRLRETNIHKSKQFAAGLGFGGWLLVAIAGSALSRIETGGAKARTPVLEPRLHGVVLTTNNEPIVSATVTIKGVLAGRGAVYVFDAPDCNRQSITKADGSFAFDGLATATKFQGMVVASGYESQLFGDADPASL